MTMPHKWKRGDAITAERLDSVRKALTVVRGGPGVRVESSGNLLNVSARPLGPLPRITFWIRITNAVPSADPNRWLYVWDHVVKTGIGYGGWSIPANPKTVAAYGAAYNATEDINSDAGVQGHGVDIDGPAFPAGFDTQPCPIGQIVLAELVTVRNAERTREVWFSHGNAVDGECG